MRLTQALIGIRYILAYHHISGILRSICSRTLAVPRPTSPSSHRKWSFCSNTDTTSIHQMPFDIFEPSGSAHQFSHCTASGNLVVQTHLLPSPQMMMAVETHPIGHTDARSPPTLVRIRSHNFQIPTQTLRSKYCASCACVSPFRHMGYVSRTEDYNRGPAVICLIC